MQGSYLGASLAEIVRWKCRSFDLFLLLAHSPPVGIQLFFATLYMSLNGVKWNIKSICYLLNIITFN
jgi:hypothetical protein